MTRIRPKLTFANVCSIIALVVALTTGGAYAADSILSADIVDGEVKTQDLNAQAVTGAKLDNNSIDASKVAAGSLTTSDLAGVDELVTVNLPKGLPKGCIYETVGVNGVRPGDILITQAQAPKGVIVGYSRLTDPGKVPLDMCNLTGATVALDKLRVHIFTLSRRHSEPHEGG